MTVYSGRKARPSATVLRNALHVEHYMGRSINFGYSPNRGESTGSLRGNAINKRASILLASNKRLALLRLVKQVGKPAHGGMEVSLSRDELAQMTGTTLFTISRILSKWGEEGFVQPRREAVVVLDSRRLAQVSTEVD